MSHGRLPDVPYYLKGLKDEEDFTKRRGRRLSKEGAGTVWVRHRGFIGIGELSECKKFGAT